VLQTDELQRRPIKLHVCANYLLQRCAADNGIGEIYFCKARTLHVDFRTLAIVRRTADGPPVSVVRME